MTTQRGEIYYYEFPHEGKCVHNGMHPCVVISNNISNKNSEIVNICAITSTKDRLPMHVEINGIKNVSYVLCEQVFTIRQDKLGHLIGYATKLEMARVSQALLMQVCGIL